MNHSIPFTTRQAAQIFASLRKALTPLSHLMQAPLHVGYIDSQTLARLHHFTTEPQPIYLKAGIWHAAVRGLGDKGKFEDDEMADFVDPFEATRNLLASARQNIDWLVKFLEQVAKQPNAAHILERCIREPETRTLWMTLKSGAAFPTEQEIDQALDQVHGKADGDASRL